MFLCVTLDEGSFTLGKVEVVKFFFVSPPIGVGVLPR
jgi:hypothetical protein